uniref:Uncharacterized protein n=1 Tax=Heterorhabditis bacteriophora TaxID=37862 RepID=A0A1I7WNW4_HETBA
MTIVAQLSIGPCWQEEGRRIGKRLIVPVRKRSRAVSLLRMTYTARPVHHLLPAIEERKKKILGCNFADNLLSSITLFFSFIFYVLEFSSCFGFKRPTKATYYKGLEPIRTTFRLE